MATNITVITGSGTTTYTVNVDRRGPVGPAGGNSVTSATTSDGTAALYLDSIRFETTNGGPTQLGEMAWESNDGSIDAQLENGVIAAFAEDGLIRVRNTSGVPIAKGDALRYIGTNGATGRLNVAKWVGANVTNAREFIGFAACAMENNSNGYAQWFGKLEDINTSGDGEAWIDGQIIYAVGGSSATITDTAPTAAGEYVVAAAVINAGSGTSGSMFVRPSFAKNIASADIVDASDFGATAGSGKVVLFGVNGQISAPYFFAAGFPDVPNATYGISSIATVDAIGNPAATMNFPTTGSGTLMLGSNNLSDLSSASTARTNLGLGTGDSPTFSAITATNYFLQSISGAVLRNLAAQPTIYGNGNVAVARFHSTAGLKLGTNILGFGSDISSANTEGLSRISTGLLGIGTGEAGSTAGSLSLTNLIASGYLQGAEMTAPAAPPANGFRIFAEDNGSGKTRLMVQFATGAAQQIAIEP